MAVVKGNSSTPDGVGVVKVKGGSSTEMAAFDSLPPVVRSALSYATIAFSACEAKQALEIWGPHAVREQIERACTQMTGRPDDGIRTRRLPQAKRGQGLLARMMNATLSEPNTTANVPARVQRAMVNRP